MSSQPNGTGNTLTMRILVIGAYGLIGLELCRQLHARGHEITGLGRDVTKGARLAPNIGWVSGNIAAMGSPSAWSEIVANIDVVINASGALQSSHRDNLDAVHNTAIVALVSACERADVTQFIQISAPGASANADTEFMRTKAAADNCVKSCTLRWTVLRPGLVLSANAYGGTALIRMLASVPIVQPLICAEKLVQTVASSDLTQAVVTAIDGDLLDRLDIDLVEDSPHELRHLIAHFRTWMGFAPARFHITIPYWIARLVAKVADGLAYLGWRSPLRTTTLTLIEQNVLGDAKPYKDASGATLSSLQQTLADLPSTLQERWFARLYLIMPMIIASLSAFWSLSGVIAIWDIERASALLAESDLTPQAATFIVLFGAIVDIALGVAILIRPYARFACLSMAAVTVIYLAGGTILRPDLWMDPLGPLLKTLPAMVLALTGAVLLEER